MHRLKYNYETTDNRHVFNVCYKKYIKQKYFLCHLRTCPCNVFERKLVDNLCKEIPLSSTAMTSLSEFDKHRFSSLKIPGQFHRH